ncbi:MAG: hypothetical protein U5K38_06930 [Woeseiaceae bacterium]|nr:hypothetical protein [Woeseiaceae bacterium]
MSIRSYRENACQASRTRCEPHAYFLDCYGIRLPRQAMLPKDATQLLVRLWPETRRRWPGARKLAAQPPDAPCRDIASADVAYALVACAIEIEETICRPAGFDTVEYGVRS